MSTGRLGAGDTAIQPTILDAKGDLIVATAADTPARLAVGTNGQALLADSTTATGLKWGAVGKVLQVVQGTKTGETTTTSSTFADTGLSVSITPSATSSKILVIATMNSVLKDSGSVSNGVAIRLNRDSTTISTASQLAGYTGTSLTVNFGTVEIVYLDSPATTSAITYKTQYASYVNGQTSVFNSYATSDTVMSTITAIEIGA